MAALKSGDPHQIDAEIARSGAADLADQALQISRKLGILDD
jgi:hypothetical protein